MVLTATNSAVLMRGAMKLESVNGVVMNSNQKKKKNVFARLIVQKSITHKDKKKERNKRFCRNG